MQTGSSEYHFVAKHEETNLTTQKVTSLMNAKHYMEVQVGLLC